MKITHIQLERDAGFAVASARVLFEDSDLPEKVFSKRRKTTPGGFLPIRTRF